MNPASSLEVFVKSISHEAADILSFELRPCRSSSCLPSFSAGAHIVVEVHQGLARSYSLSNGPDEEDRYVITVARDRSSRGGSAAMHENVRVGDVLRISAPRNNFCLTETASHSVLIAGGIGITPLWSMIQRLEKLGSSWALHYAARTRKSAAFLERLEALQRQRGSTVHLHFDDEADGRPIDLRAAISAVPMDAHLYCCGPGPMLSSFEELSSARDPKNVHIERFAADAPPAEGGFTVVLARTGNTVPIPRGQSILDALLDGGIDVPYSCREGTCGTCEVRVLQGIPDHRDVVLSDNERSSNRTMMICCSGSRTERLVLDI